MDIEQISVSKLIPYANNAKLHSEQQIKQIASSIIEFGFNNPVLVDSNNMIIAGHGRVLASELLGLAEIPCIRLKHLTEAQKKAYIIADNRLAEIGGGWDEALLKIEFESIQELGFSTDLGSIGLDFLNNPEDDGENEEGENPYTGKITSPIYEPKGDLPPLTELFDISRSNELMRKIEMSNAPDDIKEFLTAAASRHIVFNYEKIAEFYAHADKELQELMEDSALVIIDFEKAVELGFVKLTEELMQQQQEDENNV